MSKIKLNSKVGEFFKQNKKKILAVTTAGAIIGTSSGCTNEPKYDSEQVGSSISQSVENSLEELNSIVQNPNLLDGLDVTKNDEIGAYHVIFKKEVPVYSDVNVETKHEAYTSGDSIAYRDVPVYEKVRVGTNSESKEYDISYEDATTLGIDELLESRIVGKSKN